MPFNEVEIRFIRQEHATRRLKPIGDLREIGMPASMFQRILEDRARKLGPEIAILRAEAVARVAHSPAAEDLDTRIQASRLF